MDSLINFIKSFDFMSHICINRPLSKSSLINKFWDILNRFPSTKSSTNPLSSSNKLEGSSRNLFTSLCNTNYARLSISPMRSLQSLSHNINISCTIIGKVNSPFLLLEKPCLCTFLLSWFITNIGTEFFSNFKFLLVDINTVNFTSSLNFSSLNN